MRSSKLTDLENSQILRAVDSAQSCESSVRKLTEAELLHIGKMYSTSRPPTELDCQSVVDENEKLEIDEAETNKD